MNLGISEILKKASAIRIKSEKILFLRENYTDALRLVIQFALHPAVKVLLPEGPAPYTPAELADENRYMLYKQARQLYVFCEGGAPALSQNRREVLFIQLLEAIHPDDAELLVAAKDKKMPYNKMTKAVFEEAYPGIFD